MIKNWVYEDELPEMTDETYDALYEYSEVIQGVRMFPADLVMLFVYFNISNIIDVKNKECD